MGRTFVAHLELLAYIFLKTPTVRRLFQNMVRTRSQAAASKAKKQSRFDILPPELVGLILERTAGTGYLAPGSSDWAGTAVAVSGLSCASRLALELVNAYLVTKCEEMHVYAQTHSLLSISGAFIRYRCVWGYLADWGSCDTSGLPPLPDEDDPFL